MYRPGFVAVMFCVVGAYSDGLAEVPRASEYQDDGGDRRLGAVCYVEGAGTTSNP